jgi:hypothetical protein
MNDRQRLEAIVAVVCKYLPPDGISIKDAMSEIIGLVDPLPKQEHKPWVGLTDDEINKIVDLNTSDDGGFDIWCDGIAVAHIVCAKLKEKNA